IRRSVPRGPGGPVPPWASQVAGASAKAGPHEQEHPPDEARGIAESLARSKAAENLREKIYAMKISANMTLEQFVNANPRSRADVETFLSAPRVAGTGHFADGSCAVTVELPLGRLYRIVTFFSKAKHPAPGIVD
ncbi:MAG: hypothetical protein QGD94_07160, partial [Planctomycetia bacterium]|nr:hypothetical protein [Planctomycetia bacterium]